VKGHPKTGAGGQAFAYQGVMGNLDDNDCGSLSPLALGVSLGTAALCVLIVYNAIAGQDGRQRDLASRLSDLESQGVLPILVEAGDFDARPTTRKRVSIHVPAQPLEEKQAEAAPALDVRGVQEGLARLGYAPGAADGNFGPKTREAIRLYERDRNLEETGTITPQLIEELQGVLASGG
jgi:hypothetical protein